MTVSFLLMPGASVLVSTRGGKRDRLLFYMVVTSDDVIEPAYAEFHVGSRPVLFII